MSLPLASGAQHRPLLPTVHVKDAAVDTSLQVVSGNCPYFDRDIYLFNKNYVIYENCHTRKYLYPDMNSFHLPAYNEGGFFALDKNGVYFRGTFIAADSTGFMIVGRNNDYKDIQILWKTRDAVYKNLEKIPVGDVASFQAVRCLNGNYFKDKNFLYYFDKKIDGSDAASASVSCDNFIYDKHHSYMDGKVATYQGEAIIPVNDRLFKTTTTVLTRDFKPLPGIDAATLRRLSASYAADQHHAYYYDKVLPVKKQHLKNVKVWEQVNRAYISDGFTIWSRDGDPEPDFDAATFGMLPHSDFCYDKRGVYEREYIEKKQQVINKKFPFRYQKDVSDKNTFITNDSRYIIYENQAYDPWDKVLYSNLSQQQITLARENKLSLSKTGDKITEKQQQYEYLLYKAGDKIMWNNKETGADAASFVHVVSSYYKDIHHVYQYSRAVGLTILNGIDAATAKDVNGFLTDKNYIYYGATRMIKSDGLEFLGIFAGYRKGCGLDRSPVSNYLLFLNAEGYWLAILSDGVSIRHLGRTLPDNWKTADTKIEFEMK